MVNDKKLVRKMARDPETAGLGIDFLNRTAPYKYTYNFTWLGRPIIQFPQDMVAVQEVIWETKPSLIIETGIAHGFVTLEPRSELAYQMSEFYHSGAALGFRWDDPAFGIEWPVSRPIVSKRDAGFPAYAEHGCGSQES